MNIRFTTITVEDLDESLKFYKEILGFIEIKKFSPMEGVNIVFLKDEDSGIIELIEYQNKPKDDENFRESMVSIGLGVVDLDRTLNELKSKGVEPIRGPIEVPSGEKFAFIKDPNGVEVELIQGFNIPTP